MSDALESLSPKATIARIRELNEAVATTQAKFVQQISSQFVAAARSTLT